MERPKGPFGTWTIKETANYLEYLIERVEELIKELSRRKKIEKAQYGVRDLRVDLR